MEISSFSFKICFLYKALYVQCIKYAYDKNKQILRSVNSYPEITALDAAINLHAYVWNIYMHIHEKCIFRMHENLEPLCLFGNVFRSELLT